MVSLPHPDDRRWRWVVGLALVAFGVVAFYARQTGIHWGGDDADYALLARGLRDLRYHDAFLLWNPPHTTYPPVYPFLLAVWGGLFGQDVATLSALSVLLMIAALGIVLHLVAVHASWRTAAVAAVLLAVNPHLLEAAGRLLSEAAMIFLAAATVWLVDRRPDRTGTVLAIIAAVLCALTRTAGVAVVAGVGLHWVLQRRPRAVLALGLASAVALGGWFLWTLQPTADPNVAYAARFGAYQREGLPLWRTLASSISMKVSNVLGSQLSAALGLPLTGRTSLDNLAWLPISVGAVGAGLWAIAGRVRVVGLVLLAYALVLLVWPFSGVRLLVPILPALVVAAPVGAERLGRLAHPRAGRVAGGAVALILIVGGISTAAPVLRCDGSIFSDTPECIREEELGLGRAVAHIDEHVPADAVIMARRGEVIHFYTDNPTVPWPLNTEARGADLDSLLARSGADYILASRAYVARLTGLETVLDGTCHRLSVAFAELPHTLLVAVHPPGAEPTVDACAAVRRAFEPAADETPGGP